MVKYDDFMEGWLLLSSLICMVFFFCHMTPVSSFYHHAWHGFIALYLLLVYSVIQKVNTLSPSWHRVIDQRWFLISLYKTGNWKIWGYRICKLICLTLLSDFKEVGILEVESAQKHFLFKSLAKKEKTHKALVCLLEKSL